MMTFNVRHRAVSPFPHFECVEVFEPYLYEMLLGVWPQEVAYQRLTGAYDKYSLSERCAPGNYKAIVSEPGPWRSFWKYIKQGSFIRDVVAATGFELDNGAWSARFEFSSLPSEGGAIAPHRDIASKVITVIVPMTTEAVPGWGTDILEPLEAVGDDYQTPRHGFRSAHSFTYAPNTCGIFLKTENSWHAIGPLKGPAGRWRRTLTINVERA
jgi:hypothetical protein